MPVAPHSQGRRWRTHSSRHDDGAYPLVDKVLQDKQVGYLLSPPSLVLAAARLVLAETPSLNGESRRDVAQPSVRDFRRWIGERGSHPNEDGPFLAAMKSLLEPAEGAAQSGAPARFHATLTRFCELVLYREAQGGALDVGLPRKLLLSVNPLMLHPVFYWLDQRRNDDAVALEKSRLPLLRYLIFSLLGLLDVPRASLYAVEILRQDHATFPDRSIYRYWRTPERDRSERDRAPAALTLPTPAQLAAPFATPPDGLLRDAAVAAHAPTRPRWPRRCTRWSGTPSHR
jgi:hypothetical protein